MALDLVDLKVSAIYRVRGELFVDSHWKIDEKNFFFLFITRMPSAPISKNPTAAHRVAATWPNGFQLAPGGERHRWGAGAGVWVGC